VRTGVRKSGGNAIALPPIGFGGGSAFCSVGEDEAARLLSYACASGFRYFDTAPFYGQGLSELRFGATLRGLPRGSFLLSSKAGRLLTRSPAAAAPGKLPFEVVYDYSYDGVMRSLEDSWKRLGMDRIDIVYLHDCSPTWRKERFEDDFRTAVQGGYRALDELRSAGTIGAIGVGIKDWEICLRFARAVDLDLVMLAGGYTLLDHASLEEFLPYCSQNGIAVVLASPFNSGILAVGSSAAATYSYQPPPPGILERVRRLEAVCGRHRVPLGAAAIQFPLGHRAITTIVAGFTRKSEVDTNLAWLRMPVPPDLWSELKSEGLLPAHAPVPEDVA
jgi:D-threo-aldose 1-dehydrogenase